MLQALERGAALVHTPPDAFLAVVDKSIPTACGLAGAPAPPCLLSMLCLSRPAEPFLCCSTNPCALPPCPSHLVYLV